MATLRGGQVDGTPDDDLIYGEGSVFVLHGNGGDDTIFAPTRPSEGTITGGEGDDLIYAYAGDISIDGGDGDDVLEITRDSRYISDLATLDGGGGHDTLVLRSAFYLVDSSIQGVERVEIARGVTFTEDQIVDRSGANLFEIAGVEGERGSLTVVIDGDRMNLSQLQLDGITSSVFLIGSVTAETMVGTSYRDFLLGLGGDDRLYGGDGRDGFSGGRGDDTLIGGDGDDSVRAGDGADSILGGDGNDTLYGDAGADTMIGGEGDDRYLVDDVRDYVHDGAGRGTDMVVSSISYTLGNDIENLFLSGAVDSDGTGNNGANVITGSSGRNVIDGGRGADTLTGRAEADVFAFSTALGPGNVDHVTDFRAADSLQLSASVFSGLSAGGLSQDAFVIGTEAQDADDRIIYDDATGSLRFDRDGSGVAKAVLFAVLDGAPNVTSSDFVIV